MKQYVSTLGVTTDNPLRREYDSPKKPKASRAVVNDNERPSKTLGGWEFLTQDSGRELSRSHVSTD